MKLLIFKIHLFATCISFLPCFITAAICNADHLAWYPNTEEDLAGYKAYYGTSSENYDWVTDLGEVTQCELSNLHLYEDVSYFISITAYDSTGNESGFSNELYFTLDEDIPDFEDNCPDIYNPDQEDTYPPGGNDIGNACECEGDFDCNRAVDALDAFLFQADFGRNAYDNPCTNLEPCNGDFDCDGDVDALDYRCFKADSGRNALSNPCPDCLVKDWCVYGAEPDSCVKRCDEQTPLGCWCDAVCVRVGDCCFDACAVCGYCP